MSQDIRVLMPRMMRMGAGCTVAAGHSRSRDPHASLRAIGSEQGERDRRDACVAYVPDGRPRFRGQARGGDVIGDAPEGRDVRATPVARDVVPQLPARLDPGERGGRRRGDVLVRPWWQGPAAACGQCRCSGRSQERSHRSILARNGTPVLVLAHSSRVAGARSWLDAQGPPGKGFARVQRPTTPARASSVPVRADDHDSRIAHAVPSSGSMPCWRSRARRRSISVRRWRNCSARDGRSGCAAVHSS
jgi:hypothetical protein